MRGIGGKGRNERGFEAASADKRAKPTEGARDWGQRTENGECEYLLVTSLSVIRDLCLHVMCVRAAPAVHDMVSCDTHRFVEGSRKREREVEGPPLSPSLVLSWPVAA